MTAYAGASPETRQYAMRLFTDPNVHTFNVQTVAVLLGCARSTVLQEIKKTDAILGIPVIRLGGKGHARIPAYPFRAALGYKFPEAD